MMCFESYNEDLNHYKPHHQNYLSLD